MDFLEKTHSYGFQIITLKLAILEKASKSWYTIF